ncbi:MAG: winged helix-turn-helix transcriptional regulator [Lentisphaeria bacterium]|nr:winged helix-turn-helix transcriptional regulator [Lentisphaeria bacterium]
MSDKEKQVISRQRVVDHGEVMTARREVDAMLDLVKQETERIESRFLEPACGTGNFLIVILERKLAVIERKLAQQEKRLKKAEKRPGWKAPSYEPDSLLALSSIYGIDILWQIHPFMEGNTRTTAVFTIFYLRKFGFAVDNEPFKLHSWYFRNALVRANYNNYAQGIFATTEFLERFFENLLFHGKNELKSRFCHILWKDELPVQSANSKCKNCTLEEAAVLEFLKENPRATQKMIAERIGKSERTVKTLTRALQEKNLLARKNGKRDGIWEVLQ